MQKHLEGKGKEADEDRDSDGDSDDEEEAAGARQRRSKRHFRLYNSKAERGDDRPVTTRSRLLGIAKARQVGPA